MSGPGVGRPPARTPEFWWGGLAFVAALTVTAAVAAWPIYASTGFVVLAIAAPVLGGGLAFLATVRRWSAPLVGAVAVGVVAVVGVPLAVPSALSSLDRLPRGFVDLALGLVTGWKQLVTIEIPVGDYQATLAPALVVFFAGPLLALLATWRVGPSGLWAAPVLGLMQAFGLLFGAADADAPVRLGPLALAAPREMVLGFGALLLLVALLVWRADWRRRAALRVTEVATGVHHAGSQSSAVARRALTAAGMLAVAALAAGAAAPALATAPRAVLRSTLEPDLRIRDEVSPLAAYRESFAGDAYESILFRLSGQGAADVDRIRLATLESYDGQVYRVGDPRATPGESTDFRRVPTRLPGSPSGGAAVAIEIESLDGIWAPLPVGATEVSFSGDRAAALADSFYYSDDLDAGVGLAADGWQPGDVLLVRVAPASTATVAGLAAPRAGDADEDPLIPTELERWVERQGVASDGQGLQDLVDRLRARGYLSHALTETSAPWLADLDDAAFVPSAPGHSLDRIAALFAALLRQEDEVGASPDAPAADAALVAAVGDDEQFATAAALLARHLGFSSRVVVGFRVSADVEVAQPAACGGGECRGRNLTAWAEVRDVDGSWLPLDASPQFANPLTPAIDSSRDPEIPTEVPSQIADSVVPPEGAPGEGGGEDEERPDPGVDLSWLWAILRVVGTVALVAVAVLAPFASILAAKAFRRAARRREPDPESRIARGWQEWLDAAVDHGARLPANSTRSTIASAVSLARRSRPADVEWADAGALAERADRAVFAAVAPDSAEGEAFWAIVDADRRLWATGLSPWQRVRAALSLRSFTRAVDARQLVSAPARRLSHRWGLTRGLTSARLSKGVTRARR